MCFLAALGVIGPKVECTSITESTIVPLIRFISIRVSVALYYSA